MLAIVLIAIGGANLAELVFAAALAGAAAGYGLRHAIASDVSKLKLATVIARLENAAKEDAEQIREAASSIALSLRTHL